MQCQEIIGSEKLDYKELMELRRENSMAFVDVVLFLLFFTKFGSQGSENIGWWLQGWSRRTSQYVENQMLAIPAHTHQLMT